MIGPTGKPSQAERLMQHNDDDEQVNFHVLDCMTVEPQVQPTFSQQILVNPVPETPAIDSDSDFLTELGDTNENTSDLDITSSSASLPSIRRTTRNVQRIDY